MLKYNQFNLQPTNVSINGANDGTISIVGLSGGTSPYTYVWDDPLAQSTQTATGLMAGTYNVTVTDATGCSASASAVVGDPSAISLSAVVGNESAAGAHDGSVKL